MKAPRQVSAAFGANVLHEPNECLLPSKLAAQLGLTAPPPLPLAGGAGCTPRSGSKPDVSFKALGAAAQAACKWRRAARGELGADESLMHDACTVIERRTMSRCGEVRAGQCWIQLLSSRAQHAHRARHASCLLRTDTLA